MNKKVFLILVCVIFSILSICGEPLKRERNNFALKNIVNSKSLPTREVILRNSDENRENPNSPPPFDFNSLEQLKEEVKLAIDNGKIIDEDAKDKLLKSLNEFDSMVQSYKGVSNLSSEDTMNLMSKKYEVENLLGIAIKGEVKLKSRRFYKVDENKKLVPIESKEEEPSKVNTGWILDQHIYDPTSEKYFPSIPSDIRSNDEGAGDIEVDSTGWVWNIHSFYFSDPVLDENNDPTHPTPSYCLGVYLSPDGGATWLLYEVLYDTNCKDIINPRLAIDILPVATTGTRIFISYEYAYSLTDHDIYVYSENFSSTPDVQDAPIATTSLMEQNPDIASDYQQGQTSYRVVAYEVEASSGSYNHDIYASQSTGNGSSWTSPVAVAADASPERNPSLSNGASGSSTFSQYMHLAYNYDTYQSSQLLLNNGFESGDDGNWTVNSPGDINCGGGYQRTGSCCAWLAGVNNYTDYIYQDVTVPANALSANFSFYLKISSGEGTSAPYDYLYIQLRDTSNNIIATLQTFSNVDKNTYSSYQQVNYNLLSYAGQTLRVYFYATTDSSLITSFFIDDTAFDVVVPAGYEIRYAKAQHPGATPYPNGLQSSTKIAVLTNVGLDWPYGPPSVIATHGGGSSSWTQGRVAVAAHQHFPVNQPYDGDLERNQVCFAWNMCNGSSTCGTMTCGSETLSKNWQEGWFYDGRGDEKYPSLIQDGVGVNTSGLSSHPYIYMSYFHRTADEPTGLGEIQLILADPSDETCEGFIQGYWYYFTASYTVTDPDNLVDPKARTINSFNYWDGWPGVSFNKYTKHLGGGNNDDVYCTTLGDNYTFYTFSRDQYLNLNISFSDESYSTPHTFAWAAGYKFGVTAISPQDDPPYTYVFSNWSNNQTDPLINIDSDFCNPVNPCPVVNYIATYFSSPLITNIADLDSCSQNGIQIFYDNGYGASSHDLYKDGILAVTNYVSGSTFNPQNTFAHSYFIRANFGTFYIDSQFYTAEDSNTGGVTLEVTSESWSSDKNTYSWTSISAPNYRVIRGVKADLPNLLTSTPEGCLKYAGPSTSINISGDNPSGVSGRFYWYIIQGYGGSDPNSCVGPAGMTSQGTPRNVSWDGTSSCP